MHRTRILPGAMSLLLGLALPAQTASAQQLPSVTPEQAQAGARVVSATFDAPAEVRRGDTLSIRANVTDANGNPVEGAVVLFTARGGLLALDGRMSASGRFVANTPGETTVMALVRVPAESGDGFFGIRGVLQIGSTDVVVRDYPAASIEIAELAYKPYAGTSFKLGGTVITDHGNEHATASVTWRSENPSVATVTRSGVFMPSEPGTATIVASTENGVSQRLSVEVIDNPVEDLNISPSTAAVRTGDVVQFAVRPLDAAGRRVENIALSYSVFGLDSIGGAQVYDDGSFVAEDPGAFRVVVTMGTLAADALVEVESRPAPSVSDVTLVDHAGVAHVATSDLWIFEGNDGRDYAYTGTHARGGGERMFVWDVTDPAAVMLMDSVVVNARVVNDVKVSADASWAIITREGASNRRNGIVVLDLANPAHPRIISELTDSLTAGIHNVWINGDVVYSVNDGTSAMHIIDLSDPSAPSHLGRWEIRAGETDKSLHDIWAEDGYAYLSYWDDGLVILDVGAGTHGGTPSEPTFVSRFAYGMGNTHTAWREGDYVFVGDEIGTADGMRGYVHILDVSDIENPWEVGKYDVPEAGAHNLWVEDGLMYVAYYQGGLRIVDVSGELRGDLYRQGREVGLYRTSAAIGEGITPLSTMAWGPQPHKGNIFVSDMNSGLWVIKYARPQILVP